MVINLEKNQAIELNQSPLIEVVFVIKFEEISNFSSAYFGLYWETIRDRFPTSFDNPPNSDNEDNILPPLRRVAFVNEQGDRIIQIENNSFYCNWKTERDKAPLSFVKLLQNFIQEWDFFKSWCFVKLEHTVRIIEYRLYCLNMIDINSGWKNTQDYPQFFNFLNESWWKNSTNLDNFKCQFIYTMPDTEGILKINIDQLVQITEEGIEEDEVLEAVLFHLEAISNDLEDIAIANEAKWYTSAYNCIVKHFSELTRYTMETNEGDVL